MATLFRMPGVSADSDEATLIEWSVSAGEQIRSGTTVALVETEKANVEVAADDDVIVYRLLAEPGGLIPVGDPIAVFLGVGEAADGAEALLKTLGLSDAAAGGATAGAELSAPVETTATSGISAPAETPAATRSAETSTAQVSGGRVFATPIARVLARQHGLRVEDIEGTGPNGRIIRKDVERAAWRSTPTPAASASESAESAPPKNTSDQTEVAPTKPPTEFKGGQDIPHTGLRRLIASRLQASKRDAPHFYLSRTLRVDNLLALRRQVNESSDTRVSINDFFVTAVARSLAAEPDMNVAWTDTALHKFDTVDVSVAIASKRGLVTPVVRSADKLALTQISLQIKDFVSRAEEGRLKQDELEGGSFTVSNLGMFGVDSFSAIINPPQSGILAVGAVTKQPVVEGDEILIGSTVEVTASIDHRSVDGALGAAWLQRFAGLIEEPFRLLL